MLPVLAAAIAAPSHFDRPRFVRTTHARLGLNVRQVRRTFSVGFLQEMPLSICMGTAEWSHFPAIAVGRTGPMNECRRLGSGKGGLNDRLWVLVTEG